MSEWFEGKVTLITGGNSGIGSATASAFAAEGARVIIASRRNTDSAAVVSQIKEAGGDASIAGLRGGRLGSAYFASKHGVVGLTKAAALEYADKGVRINAVAPAVIKTPMAERAFFHDAELTARVTDMHPLGRVGTPEEVANAVVWLCSENASFITGHTLPVDGGSLI